MSLLFACLCRRPVIAIRMVLLGSILAACGGGGAAPTLAAGSAAPASAVEAPNASGTPATGFFVDAINGNDANPGTMAKPFKTLASLANVRLAAGDGIYLHCNQVWRESLNLDETQLVDGSTIGPYGDICTSAPRVTGSTDLSGHWTQSNGIWSRAVPAGTPKINRLFVNGIPLKTAQYPNGTLPALLPATDTSGATSNFTMAPEDAAALQGKDLVRATVQVQTVAYLMEASTVESYSNGKVTLATPTQYGVKVGSHYAYQDKLWMLDEAGEFYHDTTTNTVFFIPPTSIAGSAVNTSLVEGAVRDTVATIGGRSLLTLKGITFDMGRTTGLSWVGAPDSNLVDVTASHNGRTGIQVTGAAVTSAHRSATITSSLLADNYLYGVDAAYVNRARVQKSSVTDTGAWLGNSFAGISIGDAGTVDSNRIQRSAYVGVRYSGTGGTVVNQNDIDDFCLRLSDGGAIYTWNGPKYLSKTVDQGSLVTSNRIGVGPGNNLLPVAGIYLDEHTSGAVLRANYIARNQYGILVNNSDHVTVDSNKLFLCTTACLYAIEAETDMRSLHDNAYTNNQFVPLNVASGTYPALPQFAVAYGLMYYTAYDDLASITNGSNAFSGNKYIQLQSGTAPMVSTRVRAYAIDGVSTLYTMNEWKQVQPADGVLSTPATYRMLDLDLDPELVPNGDFSQGLAGWTSWYAPGFPGSAMLATSGNGCIVACASFTVGDSRSLLYGQGFDMTAGQLYMSSDSQALSRPTSIMAPFITTFAPPVTSQTPTDGQASVTKFSGIAGDLLKPEVFFHAPNSTAVRVNLKVYTPGATVLFDNVSVRRVKGYSVPQTSDWAVTVQAPVNAAVDVSCASLGWPATCTAIDYTGAPFALPGTLPAGMSKLILRADSTLRM